MIIESPEGYTVDGKFYRRVSSLLKEYGLIPAYREDGNALEFGHNFHKVTEYFDRDTLDVNSVDPAFIPYLEQYQRFIRDEFSVDKVIWDTIENLLTSDVYGYAGTPDRILHNIYDIKTGAPADWVGVQLAFYKILARNNGIKVKGCYAIYFTATGYKPQAYNNTIYMTVAQSILNIKNYKEG